MHMAGSDINIEGLARCMHESDEEAYREFTCYLRSALPVVAALLDGYSTTGRTYVRSVAAAVHTRPTTSVLNVAMGGTVNLGRRVAN